MFNKVEANLIVLHDVDRVRTELQRALDTANNIDAPGLRLALNILEAAVASDTEVRTQWVMQVLESEAINPATNEMHAIRSLRQALPGLGLAAATQLVEEAKTAVAADTTATG